MKIQTSKITERGQVTIPEQFRKKYGFMSGDMVIFIGEESGLFMKSARKFNLDQLEKMFEKTDKIIPKYKLTAEQMDKINEELFK